jgi:hypothetical protein
VFEGGWEAGCLRPRMCQCDGIAEAEKLALQINKFELALPSTPGSSTSQVAAAAIVPWLWSLPPHEHSCVKVTLVICMRLRAYGLTLPPALQITLTGSGGSVGPVAGLGGAEPARGTGAPKAVVGGGAGSVQVRALALETMDAAGVRR